MQSRCHTQRRSIPPEADRKTTCGPHSCALWPPGQLLGDSLVPALALITAAVQAPAGPAEPPPLRAGWPRRTPRWPGSPAGQCARSSWSSVTAWWSRPPISYAPTPIPGSRSASPMVWHRPLRLDGRRLRRRCRRRAPLGRRAGLQRQWRRSGGLREQSHRVSARRAAQQLPLAPDRPRQPGHRRRRRRRHLDPAGAQPGVPPLPRRSPPPPSSPSPSPSTASRACRRSATSTSTWSRLPAGAGTSATPLRSPSHPDFVFHQTLACEKDDGPCPNGFVDVRKGGTDAIHLDRAGHGALRFAHGLVSAALAAINAPAGV